MKTLNFVQTGLFLMTQGGDRSVISQPQWHDCRHAVGLGVFTGSRLALGDERIIDGKRRKQLYHWRGIPLPLH